MHWLIMEYRPIYLLGPGRVSRLGYDESPDFDDVSSVENPGCLFDIGDEQLPNYMGSIISQ